MNIKQRFYLIILTAMMSVSSWTSPNELDLSEENSDNFCVINCYCEGLEKALTIGMSAGLSREFKQKINIEKPFDEYIKGIVSPMVKKFLFYFPFFSNENAPLTIANDRQCSKDSRKSGAPSSNCLNTLAKTIKPTLLDAEQRLIGCYYKKSIFNKVNNLLKDLILENWPAESALASSTAKNPAIDEKNEKKQKVIAEIFKTPKRDLSIEIEQVRSRVLDPNDKNVRPKDVPEWLSKIIKERKAAGVQRQAWEKQRQEQAQPSELEKAFKKRQ